MDGRKILNVGEANRRNGDTNQTLSLIATSHEAFHGAFLMPFQPARRPDYRICRQWIEMGEGKKKTQQPKKMEKLDVKVSTKV